VSYGIEGSVAMMDLAEYIAYVYGTSKFSGQSGILILLATKVD
jgi:hypothetical protein